MPQSEKKGDYWHFTVVGPDGRQFDLLFTDSQVQAARLRAEEQPQLLLQPQEESRPAPRTWWQRWFEWLRR